MPTTEVSHPLVKHHLTRLRDKTTPPAEFRQLVQRLSVLLAYEATQDLELVAREIETPLVPMTGSALAQRIGLVPILRAGLAMVDPILNLIPSAEVWHLGLYRDEATARPVEYYSKLPKTEPVEVALVVDPMLATGGSAMAALAALQRWGVKRLKVLSLIASQLRGERGPRAIPGCRHFRLRHRRRAEQPQVHRPRPGRRGRPDL